MAANLSCPHCGEPLPISLFGPGQPGQCPACRSQVEAYIFPEFYRETSVAPAIQLAQEQEAVCYFHRSLSSDNSLRLLRPVSLPSLRHHGGPPASSAQSAFLN